MSGYPPASTTGRHKSRQNIICPLDEVQPLINTLYYWWSCGEAGLWTPYLWCPHPLICVSSCIDYLISQPVVTCVEGPLTLLTLGFLQLRSSSAMWQWEASLFLVLVHGRHRETSSLLLGGVRQHSLRGCALDEGWRGDCRKIRTMIDWCCFYYFVRNGLVALLETLYTLILHFRFEKSVVCIYIFLEKIYKNIKSS